MLYMEIARAYVDFSNCTINVLFYHTLLKRNVMWVSLLLIAREKGEFVSSINISVGQNIFVHKEMDNILKNQIEKDFAPFFFGKKN
jgi:hypothetical protein